MGVGVGGGRWAVVEEVDVFRKDQRKREEVPMSSVSGGATMGLMSVLVLPPVNPS